MTSVGFAAWPCDPPSGWFNLWVDTYCGARDTQAFLDWEEASITLCQDDGELPGIDTVQELKTGFTPNCASMSYLCCYYQEVDPCEGIVWCADCVECCELCESPLLIDTDGSGFELTSLEDGVTFDLNGDGHREPISWTAYGSTNGWLALDRDGNGHIDSGSELFGDGTIRPPSSTANGFAALSEFDKLENGGNGDGFITQDDNVYRELDVWIDQNHNGISEYGELLGLQAVGVTSIELEYKKSNKRDRYGNMFRYRAKIHGLSNGNGGRWIYDVFLIIQR